MPAPFASAVVLNDTERFDLESLVRANSTPQALAFRAQLVLRAAESDQPSNWQIGVQFACSRDTVSKWRRRYLEQGLPGLQDAPRSGRPRVFSPEERLNVVTIATSHPGDYGCHAASWSLDDIATTIIKQAHYRDMDRTTIWRILNEADLKPHRSVYWLNSHDPDFDAKAREICQLYVQAPHFYQQGRLVLCCDEKTGMQILERKHPTQLVQRGKPAKREQDYIRHGTRVLIATFAVSTGEVVFDLGETRTSEDFAAHIAHVAEHFREITHFDWVVDNLNTHWSLNLCRVVAKLCAVPFNQKTLQTGAQCLAFLSDPSHRHVFHFTPIHGSWLNQVELWFSVVSRRFLKRGDFHSASDFEQRLLAFLEDYNRQYAHPYRWTYTGQPLVRATPFSQTRRQQLHGRAWFSPTPKTYQRLLYPPRPYRRKAA